MRNIVLEISYDGTSFYGWQKTNSGLSIEAVLETILEQILQEKINLDAASRTDRGVHACGQVVRFYTKKNVSCEKLFASLNKLLPRDIAVQRVFEAPLEFHPTLDVFQKEYRYYILESRTPKPLLRNFSWHISQQLDHKAMQKAFSYFIGNRDFSSFCNQRKGLRYEDKVRTLMEFSFEKERENLSYFRLVADNFLYKMARNLVGTMVYIGLHKIEIDAIDAIFASKSRPQAGITAPAHGLVLYKVFYRKCSHLSQLVSR